MGDKVIHAENGAELDANIAKSGLVIVDFSAAWCGPCRAIAPKYSAFSNTYTNATFVHVDVDKVTDHAAVATVSGVPTFHFYKNGAKVAEFSGANEGKLKDTIEANL